MVIATRQTKVLMGQSTHLTLHFLGCGFPRRSPSNHHRPKIHYHFFLVDNATTRNSRSPAPFSTSPNQSKSAYKPAIPSPPFIFSLCPRSTAAHPPQHRNPWFRHPPSQTSSPTENIVTIHLLPRVPPPLSLPLSPHRRRCFANLHVLARTHKTQPPRRRMGTL